MSRIGNESATLKRPNIAGRLLRIPNLVERETTVAVREMSAQPVETVAALAQDLSSVAPPATDYRVDSPSVGESVSAVEVTSTPAEFATASLADKPSLIQRIRTLAGSSTGKLLLKAIIFIAVVGAAYALATMFAGSGEETVANPEDAITVESIHDATSAPLRAQSPKAAKPRPVEDMFEVSPNLRVNVGGDAEPTELSSRSQFGGAGLPKREPQNPTSESFRGTQEPGVQSSGRPTTQQRNRQPPGSSQFAGSDDAIPTRIRPRDEVAQRVESRRPVLPRTSESNQGEFRYDSTDPSTFREPAYEFPEVANRPGRRRQ